jgi:hypothetical protein
MAFDSFLLLGVLNADRLGKCSHFVLETKGYDFRVDYDFQIRRMKHSTDIIIKLVKFVDNFARSHIP